MLKVTRIDNEPVSVRIGDQEFACEEETGCVIVPQQFLAGIRLSDIADDINIKPVERIDGHTIQMKNDITLSQFSDGSASAAVEEMFRRKFWDGKTGLSPFVAALRQAVAESEVTRETDFQDDGDYIFLHYDITITEDLEIQEAIRFADETIERLARRADQLVGRKRDGLTGMFDRGSFDSDLDHAIISNHPVALLMADIDHFKKVNDTYGHPVGDEVLRAVAKILQSKCHGCNLVAYRYGGEELAMILMGEAAGKASEIAESIRAEVEQLHLDFQPDLRITISLGVSVSPDVGRSAAELVKRADAPFVPHSPNLFSPDGAESPLSPRVPTLIPMHDSIIGSGHAPAPGFQTRLWYSVT